MSLLSQISIRKPDLKETVIKVREKTIRNLEVTDAGLIRFKDKAKRERKIRAMSYPRIIETILDIVEDLTREGIPYQKLELSVLVEVIMALGFPRRSAYRYARSILALSAYF
jgi:hypothetical protein